MPFTLIMNIGWIRCPRRCASSTNSIASRWPSGRAGNRVSGFTFMGLAPAAVLMASMSSRSSGE